MSVRKRTWYTAKDMQRAKARALEAGAAEKEWQEFLPPDAIQHAAWIVDYVDQEGDRHIETFKKKRDADDRENQVGVAVREGTHTAKSKSATIAEAAQAWLDYVKSNGRQRATLHQYGNHMDHISGRIGDIKLANLSATRVNQFRNDLLLGTDKFPAQKPVNARKILTSLKSILTNAQRSGMVAQNVALSVKIETDGREPLEIGKDIPSTEEIRKIIQVLDKLAEEVKLNPKRKKSARLRPALMTIIFTGLRASELRGLRWQDIDLKAGKLTVRQRADKYHEIGRPKTKAGVRTIPLAPHLVNILREWKLACQPGALGLAFPSPKGEIDQYSNLVRKFTQVVRDAGLLDHLGEPKYTGLHSLRHFYASWCINPKDRGGLELPVKVVQSRLGHAKSVMTLDIYGHLFPSTDDGKELAEGERALLGE